MGVAAGSGLNGGAVATEGGIGAVEGTTAGTGVSAGLGWIQADTSTKDEAKRKDHRAIFNMMLDYTLAGDLKTTPL